MLDPENSYAVNYMCRSNICATYTIEPDRNRYRGLKLAGKQKLIQAELPGIKGL